MTKLERRRDKYIRRKYGRSLRWYNAQLAKQGGHCYCCPFKPLKITKKGKKGLPLHIEHDHRMAGCYIYVFDQGGIYAAYTKEFTKVCYSRKKLKAKRKMRQWLRRKSVRGLVCWPCNAMIRKSGDNPDKMRRAARMLDIHQKKMQWRKYAA